jgi:hypothetical protein
MVARGSCRKAPRGQERKVPTSSSCAWARTAWTALSTQALRRRTGLRWPENLKADILVTVEAAGQQLPTDLQNLHFILPKGRI